MAKKQSTENINKNKTTNFNNMLRRQITRAPVPVEKTEQRAESRQKFRVLPQVKPLDAQGETQRGQVRQSRIQLNEIENKTRTRLKKIAKKSRLTETYLQELIRSEGRITNEIEFWKALDGGNFERAKKLLEKAKKQTHAYAQAVELIEVKKCNFTELKQIKGLIEKGYFRKADELITKYQKKQSN